MLFWYKIADHADQLTWQPNGLCSVTLLGKPRILARVSNTCKAFAAGCPHAGAPLIEGTLNARGEVVCPLHHYRFRLDNGYNSSGEGYRLKTYPVEEREDGLYLGLSEPPEDR